MSDGVDEHSATFTTLELLLPEAHNVWPPVPSGPTADVFSIPDVGWWFWPTSINPVTFTVDWDLAGVYKASGLSWDASGESYATYEVKATITPDAGAAIEVIAQEANSYVQNKVNPSGTSILNTSYGVASHSAVATLSFWADPAFDVETRRLIFSQGLSVLFTSTGGGRMNITLKDSGGVVRGYGYIAITAGFKHYCINVDLSVPSLTVTVDGVAQTVTYFTGLSSGTGLLNFGAQVISFFSLSGAGFFNGPISDLIFANTAISAATLYNGGSPLLPDDFLGSAPWVYMGGNMTADEKLGNAAQGWNDRYAGQGTLTWSGTTPQNFVDV